MCLSMLIGTRDSQFLLDKAFCELDHIPSPSNHFYFCVQNHSITEVEEGCPRIATPIFLRKVAKKLDFLKICLDLSP